jgi:hypothetical protein
MAENQSLRFRGKIKKTKEVNKAINEDSLREQFPEDFILKNSFWLTRVVFLRALAFIYFVAFLVSFDQNKELIGDNGLLPANLYLSRINGSFSGDQKHSKWQLFAQIPTLFWFLDSWDKLDHILDLTALTGMILSLIIFIKGAGNVVILGSLWIMYHSIVNVGQSWYSFGWESQLLETGT